MTRPLNRHHSLEELKDERWPAPSGDATRLVATPHALRRKPIGELTVEGMRLLIGQGRAAEGPWCARSIGRTAGGGRDIETAACSDDGGSVSSTASEGRVRRRVADIRGLRRSTRDCGTAPTGGRGTTATAPVVSSERRNTPSTRAPLRPQAPLVNCRDANVTCRYRLWGRSTTSGRSPPRTPRPAEAASCRVTSRPTWVWCCDTGRAVDGLTPALFGHQELSRSEVVAPLFL
ncbi:contact-dependent growth inhibition system immunity protein [Streptomyces sp. NBC_01707]|uniref:contact-dependent growth inhibition system immunity protein n=1 Tax=Streptomyces sp. NBC_01707 TaxID=2975914 RepID=UPI00352DF612